MIFFLLCGKKLLRNSIEPDYIETRFISHEFDDIFTTAASLLHEQTVCKVRREAGIPSSAEK